MFLGGLVYKPTHAPTLKGAARGYWWMGKLVIGELVIGLGELVIGHW